MVSRRNEWVLIVFVLFCFVFHERTVLMKQENRNMKKTNVQWLSFSTATVSLGDVDLHVSYIDFLIIVSLLELPPVNPLK